MKRRIGAVIMAGVFILSSVLFYTAVPSKADNPIVQNIYTADPAPMVSGDTLYLYTGHDEDKLQANFYTMYDWKCYSTKDMVNWTDHGTVLSLNTFDWAQDRAWAPQCIERNGKYYMYAPIHEKKGGMVIGVAVSDSPTGPFEDALGKPLVKQGDWNNIDPTVYIDDDGQAYLYFGNPQIRYVKLNEDMISYDTTEGDNGIIDVKMNEKSFGKKVEKDNTRNSSYAEAPWFYKRGNLYYMLYAGFLPEGGSEHLAYSTSTSPTGPWEYRGIFMPTQGGCYTNHPGVVDFMGHSYLFYHDQRLKGGGSYHRSVSVEEFQYNEDGTIPEIPMTTEGPEAIAKLNPYEWTEAETYAWGNNIEVEGSKAEGINLCDIKNGSYVKVKNVDFGEKGAASFRAGIASEKKATMELHLDSVTGQKIGTLDIDNTGGEYIFKILSTDISGATGVHDLYMVFKGEGSESLAKFDHWRFISDVDSDAVPDPTPKPTPVPTPTPEPTQAPTDTPDTTSAPDGTKAPHASAAPVQTPPAPGQNSNTGTGTVQITPVQTPGAAVEGETIVPPSKVKGVSVKITKAGKAKVSWKKVKGASGYQVLYSTDKKFKKGVKKLSVKKTNGVSGKLKKGRTYYFKVSAYKNKQSGGKAFGKSSAVVKIKRRS